jgi:hypothetical protein
MFRRKKKLIIEARNYLELYPINPTQARVGELLEGFVAIRERFNCLTRYCTNSPLNDDLWKVLGNLAYKRSEIIKELETRLS